jgi:hypothetical protein
MSQASNNSHFAIIETIIFHKPSDHGVPFSICGVRRSGRFTERLRAAGLKHHNEYSENPANKY